MERSPNERANAPAAISAQTAMDKISDIPDKNPQSAIPIPEVSPHRALITLIIHPECSFGTLWENMLIRAK